MFSLQFSCSQRNFSVVMGRHISLYDGSCGKYFNIFPKGEHLAFFPAFPKPNSRLSAVAGSLQSWQCTYWAPFPHFLLSHQDSASSPFLNQLLASQSPGGWSWILIAHPIQCLCLTGDAATPVRNDTRKSIQVFQFPFRGPLHAGALPEVQRVTKRPHLTSTAESRHQGAWLWTQPSPHFTLPPVAPEASPTIMVIHSQKGQRVLFKPVDLPKSSS